MAKVLSVISHEPRYKYKTEDVIAYADRVWLSKLDHSVRRVALKILEGAQIETRCSVEPIEVVFSDLSFEEKNNLYIKATIEMGEIVLRKALAAANLMPTDIDYIITTSCTGFMIPSVDAYLVNKLEMRQDIRRLPVTEMGCAGGTSALIYAHDFLRAYPNKRVAIVAVETPSLTFQKNDLSMENLVSTAIFADGAACAILGPSDELRPEIIDTDMYHFPNATHLMGYQLQNSGLKIILDRDVPSEIQAHFEKIFLPFLKRNHLSPQDIQNYMFHPGGKKIINQVEDFIGRYNKDISDSKNILKSRGNMSSATILHILEKFMQKNIAKDELGYLLAFGPGFMAQSLLVRWT
jgi:alkylresorcinol/alkylpyrone synthase